MYMSFTFSEIFLSRFDQYTALRHVSPGDRLHLPYGKLISFMVILVTAGRRTRVGNHIHYTEWWCAAGEESQALFKILYSMCSSVDIFSVIYSVLDCKTWGDNMLFTSYILSLIHRYIYILNTRSKQDSFIIIYKKPFYEGNSPVLSHSMYGEIMFNMKAY